MLLALDGLHPPSMGARVSFPGGKPKVTDGPFTEAKEVLGGYWMIQVTPPSSASAPDRKGTSSYTFVFAQIDAFFAQLVSV